MGVLRYDNVRSAVDGTRRTAIRDLASMICLRPDELMSMEMRTAARIRWLYLRAIEAHDASSAF